MFPTTSSIQGKEIEDLREKAGLERVEKLDSAWIRLVGTVYSTVYRAGLLDFVTYIRVDGGSSRNRYSYITSKELANSITISFISLGILGIGLGQAFVALIFGS